MRIVPGYAEKLPAAHSRSNNSLSKLQVFSLRALGSRRTPLATPGLLADSQGLRLLPRNVPAGRATVSVAPKSLAGASR